MNKELFIEEVRKLGLSLNLEMIKKLDMFFEILREENSKYNLTRIIDENDVYLKHFYDSLTIIKIIDLRDKSICDLGSGAGFPGIVLAICFPSSTVTLIESNSKKCNFLSLVKETLKLDNVKVINQRIEEYAMNNREIFDVVTARAVAPLKHLLEYGIPLVKVSGEFVAMKANITDEEKNMDNYFDKLSILEDERIVFNLPVENAIRTLISYKKVLVTNRIYPRKYSEMKKKDI